MNNKIRQIIWKMSLCKYSVILIFLPALVVFLLMYLFTGQVSYNNLIPVWNDEVGWWGLVRNIAENIDYPGHTGYNGEYARIGNFGPWGVATLLPYALVGKIFGWNLYSMSLANVFMLGFGLFLFSLLVNADDRMVLNIGLIYFCMYICVGYSMTSMSESLRYSLTIILCGIVIHLSRIETNNYSKTEMIRYIIKLVMIGLFVLYAINAWLILALFIPLLLWVVMRKLSKWIKIAVIPIVTVVVSAFEQYVVGLVSYSYVESPLSKMITECKIGGLGAGVRYIVSNLFANLETVNPPNIFRNNDNTLFLYFILYIILVVISTVRLFEENCFHNFLICYILVSFLVGYCALYTGSGWTLCRGTNAGLFAASLCSCVFDGKSVNISVKKTVFIAGLIGIVVSYDYYFGIVSERTNTASNLELIYEEQVRLNGVMDISPENDAWDNTIAEYGTTDFWYLAMPIGAHGNYMLNRETNTKARYVIIRSTDGEAENVVNEHINNGHSVILKDDIFIVLKREGF